MPKRLVIDVDLTLTAGAPPGVHYEDHEPRLDMIEALQNYKRSGFEIVLFTARGMRTHGASVGKLNAFVLPSLVRWLDKNTIPYDEIHIGKPWCGTDGFYVDDRAIRPSEFLSMTLDEIHALVAKEKTQATSQWSGGNDAS